MHSTAAPLTHALSTSLTSSLVHFYYCTYCYYYHDYCRYCQRWESYTQVRRAATSVRLASGGDAAIPASFSPWSLTPPLPPHSLRRRRAQVHRNYWNGLYKAEPNLDPFQNVNQVEGGPTNPIIG